jgi:hypothetical protein
MYAGAGVARGLKFTELPAVTTLSRPGIMRKSNHIKNT